MFSIARGRQFFHYVLPAVLRPLRVLGNQLIGFIFIVFAIMPLPRFIQIVREFKGDAESFFRLILTGVFMFSMAGFGIHSFWRAYKVPK